MEKTYDKTIDILDVKHIAGSIKGYTLPIGRYKVSDINSMLKSLLPKEVKVNITFEDFRIKSILTANKTIRFTQKTFFYVILGFTQSH